jgi:glutathione-regulated potassium-efflux system ancillary protein KefC
MRRSEAQRQAMRFRRRNFALFEAMHPHHKDRARSSRWSEAGGRAQLEEQMARERAEPQTSCAAAAGIPGWEE